MTCWSIEDGQEWLILADGLAGAIKRQVLWPTKPLPHVYNNFRTAISPCHRGYAGNSVMFTNSGGLISMTVYDREVNQRWQRGEQRKRGFFSTTFIR